MYYELMADIILGIVVITLILGMIPMAIPVGLIDALLYGIDTFTTKENEELT